MKEKRVFITGIEGFTGHYLVNELCENGYKVFGTSYRSLELEDIQTFVCDLCDRKRLTELLDQVRPDFIVNLAGIAFVAHQSVEEIYRVNQLGVLSLLEAISASKCHPQKVLLAGSAHIYGNQPQSPVSEVCAPKPNSDYAVSKLAMEQLASLWTERLPIIITRPFNYTGVGQNPMFLPPKIVQHFAKKQPEIELGNLDIARDWSDVRDVVHNYRLLLESNASGVSVNICSGTHHTLQSILDMLTELSGHKLSVRINPEFVRKNEIKVLSGDNSLLQSLVGKITCRPLHETLMWMYQKNSEFH